MGLALKVTGTLPAGSYPHITNFLDIPQGKLTDAWLAKAERITLDASGVIAQIEGRKGGLATQETQSNMPAYSGTAVNGRSGIVGDGVNDNLLTTVVPSTAGYMVVAVSNVVGTGATYEAFIGTENPSVTGSRIWIGRKHVSGGSQYGAVIYGVSMTAGGLSPNVKAYGTNDVVGVHWTAAGAWSLRVNGVSVASGTSTPVVISQAVRLLNISYASGAAGPYPSNAPLNTAALYSGSMTSEELNAIDSAIAARIA